MNLNVKEGCTLLELLRKEFGSASNTTLKSRIIHGNVQVNGKTITNPVFLLTPDDKVVYIRGHARVYKIKPPFPVVFEDEFLLVAEKPAGVLTVGKRGEGGTSFYQQLLSWMKDKTEGREKLFVVHRLDREVSGLLMFAKTEHVQQQLKENWKDVRKLYYALVEGAPGKEQGTIRSWLAEGKDQKVFSTRNPEGAKLAVTRFRTMDRTEDYTLLEVELETGRKNQIRVHLSEMGCPVVGDRRYGADDRYHRRIRLHAFHLSLKHPETEKPLELKSRMPKYFLVLNDDHEKY